MRRIARQHETLRTQAGVQAENYTDFKVRERVMTADGYAGRIEAVYDGPYPGAEAYDVKLDGGMGGGLYTAGQLKKMADEEYTATKDYPELAEILVERPDPGKQVILAKKTASVPNCYFCHTPLDQEDIDNSISAHEECQDLHSCPIHGEHDDLLTAERHRDTYTDWGGETEIPEQLHRGIAKELPPEVHHQVHDSSRPVAERAHALMRHLGENPYSGNWQGDHDGGLGVHWTDSEPHGKAWGSDDYTTGPVGTGRKPTVTHIVFHAQGPESHHLETDPDELHRRNMWGYDHPQSEREVPLKLGAPVHLTGVSFKHGGEDDWHRHDFNRPMVHTASTLPDDHKDKVYLRFGHWPEDERSNNNVMGGKEDGVSVYDLDHHGEPVDPDANLGRWHEHDEHCEPDCDLDSWNDDYSNDTGEEMNGRVQRAERARHNGSTGAHPDDGHLVKGHMVGIGHDGEPLLRNVRRVGDWIDHRHLFIPTAEPHHLARHPADDDYEDPEETPKGGLQQRLYSRTATTINDTKIDDHPDKVYLRFGAWPHNERSMNHVTGIPEEGVSAYELNHKGDPMDPDAWGERGHHTHDPQYCGEDCDIPEFDDLYGNDTGETMRDAVQRAEHNRYRARDHVGETGHLVKGTMVGFGHDGEPLLHNVRRVGDWIDHRHLFIPTAEPHRLASHPDDDDYEPPEEMPHKQATTINDVKIDDHGDAPHEVRADNPNSYDRRSTEGDPDPKMNEPLTKKDEERAKAGEIMKAPAGVSFGHLVVAADWDAPTSGAEYPDEHDGADPEQGVFCGVAHDGPCPTLGDVEPKHMPGKTAMPSKLGPEPEDFNYRVEETGSRYPGASTHALYGFVGPHHVGTLHFTKSDDGRAVKVDMLHHHDPIGGVKGVGSAMMDALYHEHPEAWINHGERTRPGLKWWARYQDPAPERNVHNHPPSSGWDEYFHPLRVSMDMAQNYGYDSEHNPLPHNSSGYPAPEREDNGLPKDLHGQHWGQHHWSQGHDGERVYDDEDELKANAIKASLQVRAHSTDNVREIKQLDDPDALAEHMHRDHGWGWNQLSEDDDELKADHASDHQDAPVSMGHHHGDVSPEDHWCDACNEYHDDPQEVEDHHTGPTDWSFIDVPDIIHRGSAYDLPEHVHNYVHDSSVPVADRAHALMKHINANPSVGMHWSTDEEAARQFAEATETPGEKAGRPKTRVIFTAQTPEREHFETDPSKLDGAFHHNTSEEKEIPLKSGTPLRLTHVDWSDRNQIDPEQRRKTPDDMGSWYHRYNSHEFDPHGHAHDELFDTDPHRIHTARRSADSLDDVLFPGGPHEFWAEHTANVVMPEPQRNPLTGREDENELAKHLVNEHGFSHDQLLGLSDPGQGDPLSAAHDLEHSADADDGVGGAGWGAGENESTMFAHKHNDAPWAGGDEGWLFNNGFQAAKTASDLPPIGPDDVSHAVDHARKKVENEHADDLTYVPEWEPLHKALPPEEHDGWMFMERKLNPLDGYGDNQPLGKPIYTYKHGLTRKHLHLDDEGAVHKVDGWNDNTNQPYMKQVYKSAPEHLRNQGHYGDLEHMGWSSTTPYNDDVRAEVSKRLKDHGIDTVIGQRLSDPYALVAQAATDPELRFHFTAAWADVRAKAKRIRTEGKVRVTLATDGMIIGEVQGDHNTYETGIQRLPGQRLSVSGWSCGCKWGAYHWGAADDFSRFAGRMCSHALALQFEAQSRGMFGNVVEIDKTKPDWVPPRVVVKHDIDSGQNRLVRSSAKHARPLDTPKQAFCLWALAQNESEEGIQLLLRTAGLLTQAAPKPVTLYRGLHLGESSPEEIEQFHRDPIGHAQGLIHNVGSHWTDNPGVAANFALGRDVEGYPYDGEEDSYGQAGHPHGVVLHGEVEPHHIIQEGTPEWDDHSAFMGAFGHDSAEEEIPVRANAPVRVTHLTALSHDPQSRNDRETMKPWGQQVTAAANDPWGEPMVETPPKPYGATSPPNPYESPASAGPLTAPDPDSWGHLDPSGMLVSSTLHDEPEGALPSTDGDLEDADLEPENPSIMTMGNQTGGNDEIEDESRETDAEDDLDAIAKFQASAAAKALMGDGGGSAGGYSDSDIALAARTALKAFSPAEQQALINEGMDVQASNLDRLDIAGTHYSELEDDEGDSTWMI